MTDSDTYLNMYTNISSIICLRIKFENCSVCPDLNFMHGLTNLTMVGADS